VLRAALDADEAVTRTRSYIEGLSKLYEVYGPDHPLMEALMSYETMNQDRVVMSVTAQELSSGMVAAGDIVSSTGHVLLTKGQSITGPVRMHLLSCAEVGGLKEPFEVEVVSE